jgi:8-oxo-dGTP pyrophosphatase MutT (NUDIX family)
MSIALLEIATDRLQAHRPARQWLRPLMKRAAVALILQLRDGELGVLMIRRADREGDPWSGQMAFPGGRMEPADRNGLATAKRETAEEIGLHLGAGEPCLGRLSELRATPRLWHRRGLVITPYVFHLRRAVNFHPNHDVQEVVWVPLEFLLDEDNRSQMTWERGRLRLRMPCYDYRGRRIWGLSLKMLDELLALVAGEARSGSPPARG